MSHKTRRSSPDTLLSHLRWLWAGVRDSFAWTAVLEMVSRDKQVRNAMLKSLTMNSTCLWIAYTFDSTIVPAIFGVDPFSEGSPSRWTQLWLVPIIATALYINSLLIQNVASRTFTARHGSNWNSTTANGTAFSFSPSGVSSSLYRAVMIATSLAFAILFSYVPFVGRLTSFIYLCWVDAYFCFEFLWITQRLTLSKRAAFLEKRWSYFLGFGIPSTALCNFSSSFLNTAMFSLMFPAFVIMAIHAKPLPIDPAPPRPTHAKTDSEFVNFHSPHTPAFGGTGYLPPQLPVFGPILWMADKVVAVLSAVSGGRIHTRREEPDELVFNMEDGMGDSPLKSALLQHPSAAYASKLE